MDKFGPRLKILSSSAALATPGSNIGVSGVINGQFGTIHENTPGGKTGKWGVILKTLGDTDVGLDQITLNGGGYTGWHNHPAPVFVTVKTGAITWYDGSDGLCTGHISGRPVVHRNGFPRA